MAAPTVRQPRGDGARPADAGAAEGEASGALCLTVMAPNVFETFPLPAAGGAVRIGRDDAADVRITDELSSRLHARIDVDAAAGQLSIEDLGSANGTFVRGARIEPGRRVDVKPGDAVTIGFTHLVFERRRGPAPARRLHGHGAFVERLEDACAGAGAAAAAGAAFAVVRVRIDGDDQPPGRGADIVGGALRPGDLLGEYAPGDYEALLLDTAATRARAIADEAARRARAAGLTAHTAVAVYPTDGRTAEALVGRATALLRGSDPASGRQPVLKAEAMRKLYALAERAAAGHTATGLINVLILGETGTGKEVLAEWIHRRSPRAGGPLVCINCAALTESLLESELFGHEKGAFTGAAQAKPGLLETAAGGTVFLDEIGDMPAPLQTKLLRALESRQVTRVGALAPRTIDVRFLAATNRDLEADVAANAFRRDLYFRLNGISLTIPPLRERPEEIDLLARRFLADASAATRRRPPRLSAEALRILRGHAWPGNIRELRNVIERALVLCEEGEITAQHLPVEKKAAARQAPAPATAVTTAVAAVPPAAAPALSAAATAERQRILDVLGSCGGNQTRAAKTLGLSRGTLIERLKRYGIKRPQVDPDR